MSKYTFTIALLFTYGTLISQSNWDEYTIPQEGFIKDSGAEGGFTSEGVFVSNSYVDDPQFPYWTGWILGNGKDTTTAGSVNEHSCIAGEGYNGSSNFAITFATGIGSILKFSSPVRDRLWEKFYVNNNTYAYLSMLNGDSFAKQFGGETGDDPDFFLLTVKGFYGGIVSTDSVDFYLADYRFDDNSQDYIVKEWSEIDVTRFAEADSLVLSLTSSDVGMFGMNTPAYVCVDYIETDLVLSNDDITSFQFNAYGNEGSLIVNSELKGAVNIYDLNANVFGREEISHGQNTLNTGLPFGVYIIKFVSDNGLVSRTDKVLIK